MKIINQRQSPWTEAELELFGRLRQPGDIQAFLDDCPYSSDPVYRSPRSVIRDRQAHCADGALFAAAALEHLGLPPTIMELRAVRDDDHLLALFKVGGFLGAIAKSNFAGLRFREPIFRNPRELALSYFEDYFNMEREKTIRAWSVTLDLGRFNHLDWRTSDDGIEQIMNTLDRSRHYPLLSDVQVQGLRPVDQRRFDAGTLGINLDGVYKANKS